MLYRKMLSGKVTPPKVQNERFTPLECILLVRQVLGDINLDPASCEIANRTVQADKIYTWRENGLLHSWYGKVFCNPPWGIDTMQRSYQQMFIRKAFYEYKQGNMKECILFLNGLTLFKNYSDTFLNCPICIYNRHLNFNLQNGGDTDHGFGTIFVYVGCNPDLFNSIFSRIGFVLTRYKKG